MNSLRLFFPTTSCGRLHALSSRCQSSALFISDRCTTDHPVITPTLNLSERFKDLEKFKTNLKARNNNTDLMDLKDLWEFYTSLDGTRNILENRRVEIASQITHLSQRTDIEARDETEKLKLHGRMVKEDLKKLMQRFWEIEERAMIQGLALPNDLHSRTPLDSCKMLYQSEMSSQVPVLDHLVAGQSLIDFRSPYWYYLKDNAAIFDFALMYYFLNGMKGYGFKTMVPADFAHHAIVEGCCTDPANAIGLEPLKEKLNLVGGASLYSFCAYFARQVARFSSLPKKYVAGGKRYILCDGSGLFGAYQRTCVDFFSISDWRDAENIFDEVLARLMDLYNNLGWEYQVKLVSASKLQSWESLRASFEMRARHGWVEVGSVALSGTYLSERLSMKIEEKNRNRQFGHVVSGTSVDVTTVLACLLEQKCDLFPSSLKPHIFEK